MGLKIIPFSKSYIALSFMLGVLLLFLSLLLFFLKVIFALGFVIFGLCVLISSFWAYSNPIIVIDATVMTVKRAFYLEPRQVDVLSVVSLSCNVVYCKISFLSQGKHQSILLPSCQMDADDVQYLLDFYSANVVGGSVAKAIEG